jgi:hypothetical protein
MKILDIVDLERPATQVGFDESNSQSSDSSKCGDSTSDSGDHCGSAN